MNEAPSELLIFAITFGVILVMIGLIKLNSWVWDYLEDRKERATSRATAHGAGPSQSHLLSVPYTTLQSEAARDMPSSPSQGPRPRSYWEERHRQHRASLPQRWAEQGLLPVHIIEEPDLSVFDDEAEESDPPSTALESISIVALADALNVLIVGPKGSGKTTALAALLAWRQGYREAFDPHNEPGKWQCPVIGGGEDFASIQHHLTSVYSLMRERYRASDAGRRSQASYQGVDWRVTLVGDEWGGIVGELPTLRATKERPAQLGAGSLLGKLLTRGRKVGVGLLVAAHDDTAAQLGLEGEMGLRECFDYIVYLGAQATGNTAIPKEVREQAQAMQRPAIALSTDRHTWLKLTDLEDHAPLLDLPRRQRPADYAAILEIQARSGVRNTPHSVPNTDVSVRNTEPLWNDRRNTVPARSDAVEQPVHSSVPCSRSDAQLLEEVLTRDLPEHAEPANTNANTESEGCADDAITSRVITADELAKVAQAIIVYTQNGGKKIESICKGFGVTRGGGVAYRRAAWLVGQALKEIEGKSEEQPGERA